MKTLILVLTIALVCSCKTKDKNSNVPHREAIPSVSHEHHAHDHGHAYLALSELSFNELVEFNRNISARWSEDFRSWSAGQPERWPHLANRFADEIIYICPEAGNNREKLAKLYLQNIERRAVILQSTTTDKQLQMNRLNMDFIYNLKYLTGIEGYQKWEVASKRQASQFNQMKDSLDAIICLIGQKNQDIIKQQKP